MVYTSLGGVDQGLLLMWRHLLVHIPMNHFSIPVLLREVVQ